MTFLGMRKYPTPVNGPMMPFYIGGVVMFFAINSLASTMMESPAYANDPKNPKAKGE
jgi:F-type H+-transporting ATPase subunit j